MKTNAPRRKGAAVAALSAACLASAGLAAQELDIRPYEAPDSCDPYAVQLKITVTGIEAAVGILTVDVYENDPDRFLNKKGRVRRIRVPAEKGSQTVCMTAPPPGLYAAATYHDEDGDRDLDKKWNLMPKEPFALSNDPKLKLGFPPIEPSLFEVTDRGAAITLSLRTAD
ncbi:DUF2141 domain-containing protein [Parvularcula dongshanensis]|uniref:Uncharacterized protein (DUF2141 family) n=1 Tax=Parvularcula dongshanensis TaxID=1173995 RepID=A0A840I5J4_9PROT|nr:DUF2141 domain-containing protein [Parvularcula dongshanensis]MBB4659290.1 uncharacterized protein (DUF2141 family) [Parvularcula dongshanensis]